MSGIGIVLWAVISWFVISLIIAPFTESLSFAWIIPVVLSALTVFGVVRLMRYNKIRKARLLKFAATNAMTYQTGHSPSAEHVAMIFDQGHSRVIKDELTTNDGLRFGNYQYVTGAGKNRQTHDLTFIEVKLTRNLPNMVLDAKSNNFFGFSNLPNYLDKSQRLALEGDFNKHFDLYVPKQYEQDALYLLTPDVMAVLMDHGAKYDMEVVDDKLYFYKNGRIDLLKEISLREIFDMVEKIAGELRDQSDYYHDDKSAMPREANMVAPEGKRLRNMNNVVAAIAFGVFIIIFVAVWIMMSMLPE